MNNWPSWLTTQAHIGSQYPYYSIEDNSPDFSLNFNDVYASVSNAELDIQAVIEILMRSYVIGDKTLLTSIKRAPWLGKYNSDQNKWEYHDIPPHENIKMDGKVAAKKLKNILYNEVLTYIGNVGKVGILLSGGMDSRILAGILKETQINKDFNGTVIAYNWGIPESRDVSYAEKIATKYDWDYQYFPLNPEILQENFYLVQKVGAETPPYNLHAMHAVALDADSDIILAGSYGDTMGRAEYNGTPLRKAPPIVKDNGNRLGLLKSNVVYNYYSSIIEDSTYYRYNVDKFSREEYQYREVEYQQTHSRRHLTTAMSIIAMEKPLYQLFTSPEVSEFLWSLDLSIRSDELYKNILPMLPGDIHDIPWARTGKVFGSKENEKADEGVAASHRYGQWLRNDLRGFIDSQLDFNHLSSLGIFNEKALEKLYAQWLKGDTSSVGKPDTIISWLTAFSMFLKKYEVKNVEIYSNSYKDFYNKMAIIPKIKGYNFLRNRLRS